MRGARRSPSPIPAIWPWPTWSWRTVLPSKRPDPGRPQPRGFDILKALALSGLPEEQIAKPERDSVVATKGRRLGPGGGRNPYFPDLSHVRIDRGPVCVQAGAAHLFR